MDLEEQIKVQCMYAISRSYMCSFFVILSLISVVFGNEGVESNKSLMDTILEIILSLYLINGGGSMAFVGAVYPEYGVFNFLSSVLVWSYFSERAKAIAETESGKANGIFAFVILIFLIFGASLVTRILKSNSFFLGAICLVFMYGDGMVHEMLKRINLDFDDTFYNIAFAIAAVVILLLFGRIYKWFYMVITALYGVASVLIGLEVLFNFDWDYAEFTWDPDFDTIYFRSPTSLILFSVIVGFCILSQVIFLIRKRSSDA